MWCGQREGGRDGTFGHLPDTMIVTPCAALSAGRIGKRAGSFVGGTSDRTPMTTGPLRLAALRPGGLNEPAQKMLHHSRSEEINKSRGKR
jgi:hypothetical protein